MITQPKKLLISSLVAAALFLTVSAPAQAHSLWVSLFESHTHEPGHVISSIGWGHTPPLDDLLTSPNGSASIEDYYVMAPDGKKIPLGVPTTESSIEKTDPYTHIANGDLGVRKIEILEQSPEGTYQVVAKNKEGFFTRYLNKKGKMRMAPKPIDQLKDVKEVLESVKFTMIGKSFYTVGKWSSPKKLGTELEIIPTCDLSTVHPGDIITFDVFFMGKPVTTDSNAINYMTLTSDTFGGPDGFFLSSYIMNGKAQFRIPTNGHWVANVYIAQDVDKNASLTKFAKQCSKVFSGATVSFTTNP
ncbi:DUF4198 domain-containing protein [Halodesulfovibrio sp.]|uniref:DUF4198 domain-containing protein n=1 Tax=Halodesulfovibrio sp. TaxID=1912772 RepID=UPI0025C4A537|nr:DUF4198 domain-containing protein [Halodesulfovibrio sp.]